MTTETPVASGPAAMLGRLRAEIAAQEDKGAQALLLHECGLLAEQAGDEPGAAREFLSAFNADPQFREPLEALVRILTRRKSMKNLGKLLEALTRAASTPEERARAFWERASFLQDYEQNLSGAREALEEAIASNPEDATAWLELEVLSAKEGNVEGRLRALEARAELATDAAWKALLFVDLALLTAKAGSTERAYELLDAASALEGRMRFRTQVALEAVAAAEDNAEALARALESQADLVAEALEDAARGEENGVPGTLRTPAVVADLWYRAAELKRRGGDLAGWAALVQRAAGSLPASQVLGRARIAALEVLGDVEAAASAAREELERGASGGGAAALWLRVAESAALASDREAATKALEAALEADPACVPARALALDLASDGGEPKALGLALEAQAAILTTPAAKARSLVVAAFVHAVEAGDVAAGKAAMAKALEQGASPLGAARIARVLAALAGDAVWYEEATRALLAAGGEPSERTSALIELARSRLLHGDLANASEVLGMLAQDDASAWLGRTLLAYGLDVARAANKPEGEDEAEKAAPGGPEALEALARAETDAEAQRGLLTIAALRAARTGKAEHARTLLHELLESDAGDLAVAIFQAELERAAGRVEEAAGVLSAVASAVEARDVGAALHLEAALLLASKGKQAEALAELEAARAGAPEAALPLLYWALRGASKGTLEGKRRALEIADEAGDLPVGVALERFGVEAMQPEGSHDDALAALETVEREAFGDLAVAGALARLLWPRAASDEGAVDVALDRLAQVGGHGAVLSAYERLERARRRGDSPADVLSAVEAWAELLPELAPGVEWLGASLAAGDHAQEGAARRLLASRLDGDVAGAVEASAVLVDFLDSPAESPNLVEGTGAAPQLLNLEIAPPGCDPRRRASALRGLDVLGAEAELDALGLAAWSDLVAGDNGAALDAFRAVTEARPEDVAAWEGVRSAAEALGDHVTVALASAQLGALCKDDARGAQHWERAGLVLLEHTDAHDDAEIAFERAFSRDPSRGVAFDKLFRRVRARNEDDKLLGIIDKRLDVADDEQELSKLYWERARVLRKKGDLDAAMAALNDVTMLEREHVGAIALTGEIHIIKKQFAEAAPALAHLAALPAAPNQQRLMSGVAAADLYENKLGKPESAHEVLRLLHRAGLSTPPVRERLARLAARVGAWDDAVEVLEILMKEREKREGRIEASRLAMVVYRDELQDALRAEPAVAKLLEDVPDDPEAVELVLTTRFDESFRRRALGRAKATLVDRLGREPTDGDRVAMLAKIAGADGDTALRQATLGALVALGRNAPELSAELGKIDATVPSRPQIVLDAGAMSIVADPDDQGPIAELFALMAETTSLALGPTLSSLGVSKKERVDSRGGHPLRVAIAEWMGALAFETDFELYVGGPDPDGVTGVAGELPALVVGANIKAPLDVVARSAVAREAFALRRGVTAVRTRDDPTIASLVAAACIEAGASVPQPQYAVFGEVSRAVKKEISRKVRKAITDVAGRIAAERPDPRAWASAARRSLDRIAVIAAGDVSIVLSDVLGIPRDRVAERLDGNSRARDLLAFVLSPSYLEIRKKLGMGVR